ncbi:TPA: hypothetical protein DCX15_06405, partial [bacterium]|nr:hypothetical protein [bacterium]
REMCRRRYARNRAGILIGHPIEMATKLRGPVRVGYTVFELDKIPEDDIPRYKSLTEVWTTSKWGQGVLKEHGIDSKIVPEGVNLTLFYPKEEERLDQRFCFLSAARLYERKNLSCLIEAFCEEFSPKEEVVIIGLWFDFESGSGNALRLALRHVKNGHKVKVWPEGGRGGSTIIIYPVLPTKRELVKLYRSVDCGVFPYRAEGWCLPLIEMMACGKPCIATNYSGPTEFINERNCYLLSPGRLIHAVDPEFSLDGNQGRWADPPKEELKVLMRKVLEHREEAHRLGQEAARQMKNWTWDNAAQIASTYIEELEERYGLKGEATE